VWKALEELEFTLHNKPQRIRLLLSKEGLITTDSVPIKKKNGSPLRVALSPDPVLPSSPFLYHKTTHREIYDDARSSRPDCDDVLLWNSHGELTEFTIGNLVLEKDGKFLTPPVETGLLPGTYRAWLLDQGKIKEEVLTKEMLPNAQNTFMINSVQKWRKVIGDW
jgi:para-aminobenzoate synthetase/4-amino-4-deoxychorismate lyase